MKNKLIQLGNVIGTAGIPGSPVELDVEKLIEGGCLAQASSGGGKSWLMRRIFEQTFPHVQQIIIDPEGEFSTLREKFDYILAAKQGGDVVAHPSYAEKLAIKLLELRASCVIDLYELIPGARRLFVKNLMTALVNAPKSLWHPVLIGLDEAHEFAPEKGHGEAESLQAVVDIATRGRKRGQRLLVGTQRIASLSKDVAAQLKNKLVGNTTLDIDQVRAGNELGLDKKDRVELRKIDQGQFFAFGPAISREIVKVKIGPILTSHPKAGQLAEVTPAPAGIRKLLASLKELPAEAEAEIHTLADYQRKLGELEKELRQARAQTPTPLPAEKIEVQVVSQSALTELETIAYNLAEVNTAQKALAQSVLEVTTSFQNVRAEIDKFKEKVNRQPKPVMQRLPEVPARIREHVAKRAAEVSRHGLGTAELSKCERAILTAYAQNPDGITRQSALIFAGYRASGDTSKAFARLISEGWIIQVGAGHAVTKLGLDALGEFTRLPTGDKLRDQIRNGARFSPVERKLIGVIFDSYPKDISRSDTIMGAGYRPSGDTSKALAKFVAMGYVEKIGNSMLRASAKLFE